MKKVKDILNVKASGTIITISPNASLNDAVQLLAEHRIGAVVVVDENANPVGILSERDVVRELAQSGSAALDTMIKEVMTEDIIVGVLNDDLSYVMNTMTNKRFRHLPIMHEQSLVGIVSIGDLVKAQMEFYEGEARTLMQYIQGGYS